ncbi:helix-turn-helix transcriptional regulator [Clostridium sp. HMP27]|uniref:helix-turn-helix domain-containing protein n=1 Tax=Clostridium sp. HMP27 TaxID=1487921 RepID=UPI00052CD264|nr:helix-turn-helix transcriptional regulator [Clostridium sp. HMP27]KGK84830.1 hypothetical protein DP68_16340 [Clostridium sp. HMP27]
MSNFAERFKSLRLEKDLTQSQLSEELNIPRTTISSWELGRREPDLKTIVILASFFKVSVDYLIGLIDNKNPIHTDDVIKKIHNLIRDDELADFIDKLASDSNLQQMCKELKNLSSKSIMRLIKIAKVLDEDF